VLRVLKDRADLRGLLEEAVEETVRLEETADKQFLDRPLFIHGTQQDRAGAPERAQSVLVLDKQPQEMGGLEE
jgi:hypothetical protein